MTNRNGDGSVAAWLYKPLQAVLQQHADTCVECNLCVRGCAFLQEYGTPKAIAAGLLSGSGDADLLKTGFACSLCGLCGAVCPPKVGLNPAELFLEMRREAVLQGIAPFPEHKRILGYEKRGTSARYSFYGLPEGCDTVLFPGCTFPGTRPDRLMELFQHLRQSIPTLGIVLDCCAKPSHDLGRQDHFESMFGELRDYLVGENVKRILVACPNCYKVFSRFGAPLTVSTVYEYLLDFPVACTGLEGEVTVHDPCSIRMNSTAQQAVRSLINATSLSITEMKHSASHTLCCGEGGAVGCVHPEFAETWGKCRQQEAGDQAVITYCAGCVNFLGSKMRAAHVLDLLFAPQASLADKVKVARAPFTYLNRLLLKRRFKKMLAGSRQRVRRFTA